MCAFISFIYFHKYLIEPKYDQIFMKKLFAYSEKLKKI